MIKNVFADSSGGCVITVDNRHRWWWNYANRGYWEVESTGGWMRVEDGEVPHDVRLAARLEAAT